MDSTDLPEYTVEEAKAILAASVGRRLRGIARAVTGAFEDLGELRREVGFLNGLGTTAQACNRELEATAQKIRKEAADVSTELQEKPAMLESVDEGKAAEVLTERERRVS